MTATTTATLIALIAACGVLMDTLEILRARRALELFFPWPLLVQRRRRLKSFLATRGDLLLGPVFWCLVGAHAVAAVAAVVALASDVAGAALLTAFVVAVRVLIGYRLPYSENGADGMQLILWIALTLFALASPSGQQAVLAFIAATSIVAYLSAGLSKLSRPEWRDGTAVGRVLRSSMFGSAVVVSPLLLVRVSPSATWSTLALEIGGPFLLLLGPEGALIFCGVALLFHAGIAVTMGLTPFFFAFCATHPALFWLAANL